MRSLLPFLAFLYPFLFLSPVHCDNDDATTAPPYVEWLSRFGHDDFTYPQFLLEEMADCACARATIFPRAVVSAARSRLVANGRL